MPKQEKDNGNLDSARSNPSNLAESAQFLTKKSEKDNILADEINKKLSEALTQPLSARPDL